MNVTSKQEENLQESSSSFGYYFRKRRSILLSDVICLVALLVLVAVGLANTTWEEKCVDEYRDVRSRFRYGGREEVLIRTCREDIDRCGDDSCLCQNVDNQYNDGYDFYGGPNDGAGGNSTGYCDSSYGSTALVATGGWGAMVFMVAINLFVCLCCCGSCGLGALYLRDKREYSSFQANQQQRTYGNGNKDNTETENTRPNDDFASNFP